MAFCLARRNGLATLRIAARSTASSSRRRSLSSSALLRAEAQADGSSSSSNASPKLTAIVDQIEKLTLLEAAELVTQLKVSLAGVYM